MGDGLLDGFPEAATSKPSEELQYADVSRHGQNHSILFESLKSEYFKNCIDDVRHNRSQ